MPPLPVAPLGDEERIACLRLIRSQHIGPASFRHFINTYGGAQNALDALPHLANRSGRKHPLRIPSRATAEAELAAAAKLGATPLFTIEPGFPKPLAWLDPPPPLIYLKGRIELCDRPAVAIVGSRRCSAAGTSLARTFADTLSQNGFVVVSGLARGIDTAAHHAALAGGTIAVIAGGVDSVYPAENADLQHAITEHGCLITEQPPGFRPRGQDFPRRNRIISGLALGVVIIEAARRSGTLITARMALEQGRSVFAIPGHPMDPRAEGTNKLIQDGAIFTLTAEDVITELAPQIAKYADHPPHAAPSSDTAPHATQTHAAPPPSGFSATVQDPPSQDPPTTAAPDDTLDHSDRARVTEALTIAPIGIDELARATDLPAQTLQIALLELSLSGAVTFHGRNLVSLTPNPSSSTPPHAP